MLAKPQPPRIPLPKGWPGCVKSAVVHVISLVHYAIVYARAWAADSINARVRLAAENDRLLEECALLHEELRIKDTRIAQIPPQRRPHYGPHERMAILELRAARGWSLKQTVNTFLVTPTTIASWVKRIDDQGANALLQLHEPVNKFPDFVRYIVQRLKILSPAMGKIKIAETLCRAGLHLGVTTFKNSPTSVSVQHFLEHVIDNAGVTSKYLICDKGQQFWCDTFKHWCDRHHIKPRFGAVGQHGSIALIERFILSLKNECTRVIHVPLHGEPFCRELTCGQERRA